MDLRKNLPVVPVKNENPPPPVKGAKTAFFQLIGGLVAVMFLLFHFVGTSTSKTPQNDQPQQKVAEAISQNANQSQQKTPDLNNQSNNSQQNAKKPYSQQQTKTVKPRPPALKVPNAVNPMGNAFHKSQQIFAAVTNQSKVNYQQKILETATPKPRPNAPKPVSQPQAKPIAPPRPSNVPASSKSMQWLKTAGKFGVAIITKGKVRIR